MQEKNKDFFDEEFGDLLGDSISNTPKMGSIPTQPSIPVQTPTQSVVKAPVTTSPRVDTNNVTDSVKSTEAEFVKFGTKVNNQPIPRFKATTATNARISLLSDNILTVKFHFAEGVGSFLCMNDKCCELEGLPKVRYVLPIVVYSTDKTGNIISNELELKGLVLGGDTYNSLVNAVEMSGVSVKDLDIVITCSDEQYQKMSFSIDRRTEGASWKKFPKARDIVNEYKAHKDELYLCVARKMSLDMYLTKKGIFTPPTSIPAGVVNPEDLLDE